MKTQCLIRLLDSLKSKISKVLMKRVRKLVLSGLLIWPASWWWHAISACTFSNTQHCLDLTVPHQRGATAPQHRGQGYLAIHCGIATLGVAALARPDIAGEHHIWGVGFCLQTFCTQCQFCVCVYVSTGDFGSTQALQTYGVQCIEHDICKAMGDKLSM